MLKKILLGIGVLIAAVLIFAATRPDTFDVQRSATIKAAPDKVFGLINDFHRWPDWSPWEKLDPRMQRTFAGSPSGQGATYAWEGNSDVGAGRMEIKESVPPSKAAIDLHFIKPFEARSVAEFTLQPEGDSTRVVWTMRGPMSFVSKLMSLVASMDKMIGGDFEKGLANLKTAAES